MSLLKAKYKAITLKAKRANTHRARNPKPYTNVIQREQQRLQESGEPSLLVITAEQLQVNNEARPALTTLDTKMKVQNLVIQNTPTMQSKGFEVLPDLRDDENNQGDFITMIKRKN